MNQELPDVQDGFRKGRGTRDQTANIHWLIDYAKVFDCLDHKKLWKIIQEMEISDHLTYPLRNLYAGQETRARTRHETMDWFQIGKGVVKNVYCHSDYLTYMQSTSC